MGRSAVIVGQEGEFHYRAAVVRLRAYEDAGEDDEVDRVRQESPQRQEGHKVAGDLEPDAQCRDDWHGCQWVSAATGR